MTKAELVHKVKILETVNSDLDIALEKALVEVEELKKELRFIRGVIASEGVDGAFTLESLEDIDFDEDGELSKDGLRMLIRAGMDQDDIKALVNKGDEIVEWLKKKGIKLDSGGNLEDN